MTDIAVVDYGMGNLRSVSKAIEHVAPGRTVIVTSDPDEVRAAARVVFPGQGAMPDCMRELDARHLREAVLEAARSKPFLGICIGLQMLFERSEEGGRRRAGIAAGRGGPISPCQPGGRCRTAAQGAAHGLERSAADARAPAVGRHPGPQPVLFRPQLLSGPGAARDHCRVYALPLSVRLCSGQPEPVCGPVPSGEEPGQRAATARQLRRLGRCDPCTGLRPSRCPGWDRERAAGARTVRNPSGPVSRQCSSGSAPSATEITCLRAPRQAKVRGLSGTGSAQDSPGFDDLLHLCKPLRLWV